MLYSLQKQLFFTIFASSLSVPRDLKNGPRGAKSDPGESQERPGRGPRVASDPEATPEASRASFERFFPSFLGAPGTSFSSFVGAVQGHCACCYPSKVGSAGARASAYNPPTNACVVLSVFETPSAPCESLPSYSAKPGAFYALRAFRWTASPRGRTDPFQGPNIKPVVRRCSTLFQDDFGVENGGQNRAKILLKRRC